jgi:hypothetical protein
MERLLVPDAGERERIAEVLKPPTKKLALRWSHLREEGIA